jgi:adenine deaminase
VAEGARALTEAGLDPRFFILCTDDSHSATLVQEGHVDRAVRQAIAHGVPPLTAIQMATLNTAEHFGLSRDIGLIAPGRYADLLLVPDLERMEAERVIAKGRLAVEAGEVRIDMPVYEYPQWARSSVHLARELSAADFRLPAPDGCGQRCSAHVIGVIENQAPTRHLRLEVEVQAGQVVTNLEQDIARIALVERHRATGKVQVGLVQGFGFNRRCAVASTVARDCHHMLVAGTDEGCMALAANELARLGGGQIVVLEGQVIGQVALPIAGLMSNELAPVVARQAASVLEGFRRCGCQLNNPNMQLSLLALVVIPELRISDLGLVDVQRFERIPVVESA